MTKGFNKGIYNLLNLPQQIDILSPLAEARNAHNYSADGVKLRVVKKYNSNFNTSPVIGSAVNVSSMDVTKTTDYVNGKIFENNVLDRIFVNGAYIKDGVYYFYETDHLGDNRTVVSQEDDLIERNDYYPFGMQMAHNQLVNQASGSDNKRKFGNKELDVMGGLNLYDSQARWYDSCIPVLPTVDPHAENYYSWSYYGYYNDNKINTINPDERNSVTDKENNITWNDQATSAKNTPKGYTYIGNDKALLSHVGMNYSLPELSSNKIGFVAFDENVGMHMINVKEKSNAEIKVNVGFDKDKATDSNVSGKTFNGVDIVITNVSSNSGSDGDLNSSSSTTKVGYGDKTYSGSMQEPSGTYFKETGTSITQSTISIPSADISSSKSFSSISVSGSWWVTKSEGRTPVVYHGLVQVPLIYKHTWTFNKK